MLQVAVEGPDREANIAFASELVARLRKLPPELVRMAAYDVREEKAFFEANKWIFGSGLTTQFLHSWDLDRLEQTVVGASVAGTGKRPDALFSHLSCTRGSMAL